MIRPGPLWLRIGLAMSAVVACSRRPPIQRDAASLARDVVPSLPEPIRLRDLIARAEALSGHAVVVDLFESLMDSQEYSLARDGALVVDDFQGSRVHVSVVGQGLIFRSAWADAAPSERHVQAPLRVTAAVTVEPHAADANTDSWIVLTVSHFAPLALPTPERVGPCRAIVDAPPGTWDGHYVECDGLRSVGMEWSLVDNVWFRGARYLRVTHSHLETQDAGQGWTYPVRVTGFVTARPGGRYGHMGRQRAEMLGTHMDYNGPAISPFAGRSIFRELLRQNASAFDAAP